MAEAGVSRKKSKENRRNLNGVSLRKQVQEKSNGFSASLLQLLCWAPRQQLRPRLSSSLLPPASPSPPSCVSVRRGRRGVTAALTRGISDSSPPLGTVAAAGVVAAGRGAGKGPGGEGPERPPAAERFVVVAEGGRCCCCRRRARRRRRERRRGPAASPRPPSPRPSRRWPRRRWRRPARPSRSTRAAASACSCPRRGASCWRRVFGRERSGGGGVRGAAVSVRSGRGGVGGVGGPEDGGGQRGERRRPHGATCSPAMAAAAAAASAAALGGSSIKRASMAPLPPRPFCPRPRGAWQQRE